MADISNSEDCLDVREIIARVEELREERDNAAYDDDGNLKAGDAHGLDEDDAAELATLESLLEDLAGNGGDEEWEGSWYPVTLIRDSYFKDYAQELAEDTGAINADATWPNNCIDWDQATRQLQMDYSTVEYDRITYWYR